MTSDIPNKDIRLGSSSLYVKTSLHGKVVNGSYILQSTTTSTIRSLVLGPGSPTPHHRLLR